jgi:Transposase DDE domain/Transposase domain (DUF772)
MSLGRSPTEEDIFRSSTDFCRERVDARSVYGLLHREGHRLFPDEAFADLFKDIGRASVPPRIVAVVMVLQRLEGLSDREAVDRFTFDLRWKYAAGGLEYDYPGFVHTVLVDMRARLRRSERPNRIFETALEVAREAGFVGRTRVLDSTPLYDAVATQDTVTLIRSAIRGLLKTCDAGLASDIRKCLRRDDDYSTPGKPPCDWDDAPAREALLDALARDAYAILAQLDGQTVSSELQQAVQLLATVVGQDIEHREDGIFRIVRGVAKDRVISTVDPEARHGHKTAARGFDGYKGHVAVDPESEIITATEVTAGNVADGDAAKSLLVDVLAPKLGETASEGKTQEATEEKTVEESPVPTDKEPSSASPNELACKVYGDASYGVAELVETIEGAGATANVKVQAAVAPDGHFSKDAFVVDLDAQTVRCPAGAIVAIRQARDGGGLAAFGVRCASCPQRSMCTANKEGRTIRIHPQEATLQRKRAEQKSPEWKSDYRHTRPKVERKLAHLMFRRHGGRRARVRGCVRVRQDFALLGAAHNLKRLAHLGVRRENGAWTA